MGIENPILVHFRHLRPFRHFSSLLTIENRASSNEIMQNKANFPDAQMNVTSYLTKNYEQ